MFSDLIGKPYKKNGRGPDSYDCYGICIEVCKRIGTKLPEQDEIINKKFVPVDKPKLGDIILINQAAVKMIFLIPKGEFC